jgi:hypothetical protein
MPGWGCCEVCCANPVGVRRSVTLASDAPSALARSARLWLTAGLGLQHASLRNWHASSVKCYQDLTLPTSYS